MWREALYSKLEKLGFGGKTVKIIKSMYCNDSLRFLINGKYTDQLWLTQGVKQGNIINGPSKILNEHVREKLEK